ncbi:MAG: SDR family oxidoreductase [Bacilli bacterium]|nr:SDR family oxidoreductase [Bacilli bacterium]
MNFQNKVVLVTGSSRGIGRSIAVKFAKEGANVIINYRSNENEAKAITEIISSYNNNCMCIKADVSKEQDVKKMIDAIIEKYGHIDILVNNAGIAIDTDFQDRHVKDWQETLNTNLIGVFLTSKYAGKYMLENKYGKIINISSTNGIDTLYPYSIDYDASKAGIINLTKNLAIQFAPYVNVNAVAPGWVDTGMNDELSKSYLKAEMEKTLLKRFAEPEEIADVILFLASDKARYIDGEIIRVDGGIKIG